MSKTRIVIVGGGYAGMMAARRLGHRIDSQMVEAVLVSDTDYFVERIRLHQFAGQQMLRRTPINKMLEGTGVRFMRGRVTQLQPNAHSLTVQTATGEQSLRYDKLIYALGSFVDTSGVSGAAEYALRVSSPETTQIVRERLPEIAARGGRLVVCGGGLTGIETSTELAEAFPGLNVTLITREEFGEQLSERGGQHVRRTFKRMGIELIDRAAVQCITERQVEYEGGKLDYDLCIWAGAFGVPALAREAGLAVNTRGQVLVDDHLRSISHPTIYAVGDAGNPSEALDMPIRMACATAYPMGAYAADDLVANLKGKAHHAYDFMYFIRCISLGRHDALIQKVDENDRPVERIVKGWLGARIKEMISRFGVWQIWHDRLMYYPRRSKAGRTSERKQWAKA